MTTYPFDGTPQEKARWLRLIEQEVPQQLEPWQRPGVLPDLLKRLKTGGFSYHPIYGTSPTSGGMLSEHKADEESHDLKSVNEQHLGDYIKKHHDWFAASPGNHFGGWPSEGKAVLDKTSHFPKVADMAARFPYNPDQQAGYDVGAGADVPNPHYVKKA